MLEAKLRADLGALAGQPVLSPRELAANVLGDVQAAGGWKAVRGRSIGQALPNAAARRAAVRLAAMVPGRFARIVLPEIVAPLIGSAVAARLASRQVRAGGEQHWGRLRTIPRTTAEWGAPVTPNGGRPPSRLAPLRLGPPARRRAPPAPTATRTVSDHPGGRRPPVVPGWAVRTAAVAYAAVLVVVTLAPIRWRSDLARYRNNWRPQLVPLWNMVVNLRDGDRVLATLAGAAGNVALFMPLGFLLPMLAPWFDRFWRTVATGFALSSLIELSQVAFPGVRRADVNDVLMNTLGAAVGYLVYRLAVRARSRPPGPSAPSAVARLAAQDQDGGVVVEVAAGVAEDLLEHDLGHGGGAGRDRRGGRLQPLGAELLAVGVAGLDHPVGVEHHAAARREGEPGRPVGGVGEQPHRQRPGEGQGPAGWPR